MSSLSTTPSKRTGMERVPRELRGGFFSACFLKRRNDILGLVGIAFDSEAGENVGGEFVRIGSGRENDLAAVSAFLDILLGTAETYRGVRIGEISGVLKGRSDNLGGSVSEQKYPWKTSCICSSTA